MCNILRLQISNNATYQLITIIKPPSEMFMSSYECHGYDPNREAFIMLPMLVNNQVSSSLKNMFQIVNLKN